MSPESATRMASAELDEYVRWHAKIESSIVKGRTACELCTSTTRETVEGLCLDCAFLKDTSHKE